MSTELKGQRQSLNVEGASWTMVLQTQVCDSECQMTKWPSGRRECGGSRAQERQKKLCGSDKTQGSRGLGHGLTASEQWGRAVSLRKPDCRLGLGPAWPGSGLLSRARTLLIRTRCHPECFD